MTGPLQGIKVIEIAGIGPGPFCAMQLADLGADVIRVERPNRSMSRADANARVMSRGMRSVALDLKKDGATQAVLRLLSRADVLVEGFRPGVMERLGLGPAECLAVQPRLVYGRMTGWGQSGPLAQAAGHDINYIAVGGVLDGVGTQASGPLPPLNLVGDFGGGGMLLALAIAAAIVHVKSGGPGQVVDVAMFEGAASLMSMQYGMKADGRWQAGRAHNVLDGSTPYYGTYRCADGWIAIGAIEPHFHARLLECLELDAIDFGAQNDKASWPRQRALLEQCFASRSRAEWCAVLDDEDVCFAPVMSMDEAPLHPHSAARGSFIELAGVVQPAPVPRFSRTACKLPDAPPMPGEHSVEVLGEYGLNDAEIARLLY
ncbi:CaiB/BaiF CoA-transferase family protein [soil metagenome]